MKHSLVGYASNAIVMAAVTYIDVVNEYMRVLAAIAATVTLAFAVLKFYRDEKERKQRNKLTELQIENELRTREQLKKDNNEIN